MSGARSQTTRANQGRDSARPTESSNKASSKNQPPARDSIDYDDDDEDYERTELAYEPEDAVEEDEEIFGNMPGAERELSGHFDQTPAKPSGGKGGQQQGNRVLGGFKATLKNPRVSQEAKNHARQVLEENNAV